MVGGDVEYSRVVHSMYIDVVSENCIKHLAELV